MRWYRKRQRGFALPMAVFALVIVGVIITTGGFFMARQEGRIGTASEHAGMAFYLTEQGLVDAHGQLGRRASSERCPTGVIRPLRENYAGVGQRDGPHHQADRPTCTSWMSDGTVTRGGAMLSGASRRVGVTTRLRDRPTSRRPRRLTTQGTQRG